jgi:hypothetical protein
MVIQDDTQAISRVENAIEGTVGQGYICPCSSSWGYLALFVKKKD